MTCRWLLRWDYSQSNKPVVLRLNRDRTRSNRVVTRDPSLRADADRDGERAERFSVFESEAGNLAVFDGYLFDRDSLWRQLRHGQPGSVSRSLDDAALVSAAYDLWRGNLLERLRGAYTIALWDRRNVHLLIGRDATGSHPCFCWRNNAVFLVSSSLDAILGQPEVDAKFNRIAVAEHVQGLWTSHQATETFYQSIWRLPPAHTARVSNGELTTSCYWDPVPPGFSWASEEELSQFVPFFERAVNRCLSVGADSIALSGGFDSVAIASLAAEQPSERGSLHAVSLRFIDPICDEGETQMAVARALGMRHLIQTVEESLDGKNLVTAALGVSRQSPSPVLSVWQSVYLGLLQSAADLGLRSMLLGTGGDDTFDVDSAYGADLLASFDLRGLWRYYRTQQRSSFVSPLLVARYVFWDKAIKPEAKRAARSILSTAWPSAAERLEGLWRERQLCPWISNADGELIAALKYRLRHPIPITLAPGERSYARAIRRLSQAPLLALERDQGHSFAQQAGFTLLFPYFDRDLVELALRMHPEHLLAVGRAKSPLRQLVNEKLAFELPSKKVDFTHMVHKVLRPAGSVIWKDLDSLALADHGIVKVDRLAPLMERYFEGRSDDWLRTWLILSTEMWLRARS